MPAPLRKSLAEGSGIVSHSATVPSPMSPLSYRLGVTRWLRLRRLVATALCLALAMALAGCRPTDFFTEVIISPFAEEVDWNNPNWTIVNSPDADEESSELSALDWSDDATQSSEVQNVVTYSDEPTTNLSAHRSLFDLDPRFPGVKSSDPVRVIWADEAQLEQESQPDPEQSDAQQPQNKPDEQSTQASREGDTKTESGPSETPEDQTDNPEDGSGQGNPEGQDPYAGYDGAVDIYDPNNGLAEVQHADKVAATGQAAIMVQALGGKGALAAMDVDTFNGVDPATGGLAYASSFSTVFGDELADGFAETALLWREDGTSSEDLVSIDALVKACGEGGVIVYDQSEAGVETRFDLDMRKRLQAAGIQLVPIDLRSVQGMIDAASVIGDVLSESESCALDAKAMADRYVATVDTIVSQAAGSHGGTLATRVGSASGGGLLSAYNNCPVGAMASNHVYTAIATDYVRGISYSNGSYQIDTRDGLLFTPASIDATPLSFWAQAAGVWNRSADLAGTGSSSYALIWGLATPGADLSLFSGGASSRAFARCATSFTLISEDTSTGTGMGFQGNGLGSAEFPYLIVCASNGFTADQVRQSVAYLISNSNPVNAYSALPWNNLGPALQDANGNWIYGVIGSTNQNASAYYDRAVDVGDTVRANPAGLLGSWTGASMESVLETAWLARIYSASPANSGYAPINNLSKSQLRSTVEDFYNTFYFHDGTSAANVYAAVVTDEGL